MAITLERRPKLSRNQNAVYGLEYRSIAVRKEAYDKLRVLKEETGRPVTDLIAIAIDEFIKNVTVQ